MVAASGRAGEGDLAFFDFFVLDRRDTLGGSSIESKKGCRKGCERDSLFRAT